MRSGQSIDVGRLSDPEYMAEVLNDECMLTSYTDAALFTTAPGDKHMDLQRVFGNPHVLVALAGMMTGIVCECMLIAADVQDKPVVVGLSDGGRALAVAMACTNAGNEIFDLAFAKDGGELALDLSSDYGVYGTPIVERRVILVHDVTNTGERLARLADVVDNAGGVIVGAAVLVDNRNGRVGEGLVYDPTDPGGPKIPLHAVFTYDYDNNRITPATPIP